MFFSYFFPMFMFFDDWTYYCLTHLKLLERSKYIGYWIFRVIQSFRLLSFMCHLKNYLNSSCYLSLNGCPGILAILGLILSSGCAHMAKHVYYFVLLERRRCPSAPVHIACCTGYCPGHCMDNKCYVRFLLLSSCVFF